MHIRNLLVLVTLAACTSGALDSEAEGDGGDGGEPGAEGLAFEEAFLTPAYGAANAVWAGVSLLDYDGDGWLDLFFTNGLNHPDALYRNLGPDSTGRLVFTDVATEAGVDSLALNGASVAGDLDNDGDIDLVVNSECSTGSFDEQGLSYWDGGKLLYHNNGDGTFTQGAFPFFATPGDAEVDFLSLCTYSMSLADMDEDGYLDILLAQGDDPDIIPPWTFRKERGSNQNLILWNDGAGNFDRLSGLSKPDLDNPGGTEYGSETSFAIAAWDVNGDGSTDMVAGNGGFYVHVLTRRDDETFPFQVDWDRSESGHGLWMGLAPADYDGDGDFDIFATNQGLSPLIVGYNNFDDVPFDEGTVVNTHLSMLINEGGVFVPDHDWPVEAEQVLAGDLFDGYYGLHEDLMNPENLQRYGWGWGAVALDYDADGWMDVAYTGNNCSAPMIIVWDEARGAGPGALFRNNEGAGFQDVTWQTGVANVDDEGRYLDGRGIATGDLNNDGYADLVYANRSYRPSQTDPLAQELGAPKVWLSVAAERENNWLQIDLEGTESNRDGLGSIVRLNVDGQVRRYLFGAGGSTNSSNERLFTVGVARSTSVDVEVEFPSGVVVSLSDVPANQRITISEDD